MASPAAWAHRVASPARDRHVDHRRSVHLFVLQARARQLLVRGTSALLFTAVVVRAIAKRAQSLRRNACAATAAEFLRRLPVEPSPCSAALAQQHGLGSTEDPSTIGSEFPAERDMPHFRSRARRSVIRVISEDTLMRAGIRPQASAIAHVQGHPIHVVAAGDEATIGPLHQWSMPMICPPWVCPDSCSFTPAQRPHAHCVGDDRAGSPVRTDWHPRVQPGDPAAAGHNAPPPGR